MLVADVAIRQAILGLLEVPKRVGMRPISYEIDVHPDRDPGCRTSSAAMLRQRLRRFRKALVVLDRHGSGREAASRLEIQGEIELDLARNGWKERSKAIAIDPELESWLWAGGAAAREALDWRGSYGELRKWLHSKKLWAGDRAKPADPKKAAEAVLRRYGNPRSARRFRGLGKMARMGECQDAAFLELRDTLQDWFPARGQEPKSRESG